MVERGYAESLFHVQQIKINSVKLFLLWGVQYQTAIQLQTATTKPPVPVTLYKPASATPKGYPFNNAKVLF
jgi:hypothetical protein